MNFIITLIILILVLGVIVFIHELGHFLAAKKIGVYVHEFAVGMGPKIFSFKRKNDETTYSLRLLPLGGFTAIATDKSQEVDLRDDQLLDNKGALGRFFVLIMGIVFNFILALILFFINGLIYEAPVTKPYVGEVPNTGAAYEAGLMEDDLIIKVDGKKVSNFDEVLLETRFGKKKESYVFTVIRDEKEIDIEIFPEYKKVEDEEVPSFGFYESTKREKGFVASLKYSFNATYENSKSIFSIVGKLVTGKLGAKNLSGPVGVFTVIDSVKENGFEKIIELTAYLSINVAIINLIPVPVFDGGRILLLLIEKIIGRKLNPKVETTINMIGALLLIALMLYVTFNDIFRLF